MGPVTTVNFVQAGWTNVSFSLMLQQEVYNASTEVMQVSHFIFVDKNDLVRLNVHRNYVQVSLFRCNTGCFKKKGT